MATTAAPCPVRRPLVLAVAVLVAGIACGSGGSPTGPAGSSGSGTGSGSGSSCRTYSSRDIMSSTSSIGVSATVTKMCDYNRSTNEFSCTLNYSDNRGVAYTSITTFAFASVADFVGDAPRIVLFSSLDFHPTSVVIRIPTPGFAATTTTTYTYDAQKRATRLATVSSAGASATLTFTSWDSFGRPTAATSDNFAYTYNDSARTATITNLTVGGAVITQTYDANGIQILQTSVAPSSTETQTFTIQSTAQTCR